MLTHRSAVPTAAAIVFASLFVVLGAVFAHKKWRNASSDEMVMTTPLIVLSDEPYDEAEVRNRDIEFFSGRLAEDPSSATDRSTLAQLLFTRARSTGSLGDLERSEALVRESIAQRPQRNGQAFELLATLLMAQHEFRDARSVALLADSIAPGTPSHQALLGEIELELGEYEDAAMRFGAIRYDGRNFSTAARIARWHELTGRIDIARAILKRAIIGVDRRDDLPREQVAWFHYRLGELELRAGYPAAADSAFRRSLARHPDDVRALSGLTRAALAQKAWQQAIDFGERAIAIQLDPGILGALSRAYAQAGDTAQASSYARAMSVSALQQPGVIHREWGLFLLDHGTAQDRANVLKRARLELRDRKDVYGHDLLAWALFRDGQLDQARKEMALALSQKTQDVLLAEHARAMGVKPSSPGTGEISSGNERSSPRFAGHRLYYSGVQSFTTTSQWSSKSPNRVSSSELNSLLSL